MSDIVASTVLGVWPWWQSPTCGPTNEWMKEGRKEGRKRNQETELAPSRRLSPFHSNPFQQTSGKWLAPRLQFTYFRGQKRFHWLYFRFPGRKLWRWLSFEMLSRVVPYKLTDVSDMLTASIIIGISGVSDSHDDKYKGDTLPRYWALKFRSNWPKFQMCLLSPSSERWPDYRARHHTWQSPSHGYKCLWGVSSPPHFYGVEKK
jgi:hypothetical protein